MIFKQNPRKKVVGLKVPPCALFASAKLFFLLLASSAGICSAEDAAYPVKRILLLQTMPVPVIIEQTHWFRTQLAELGYIEGENLQLTVFQADGDFQRAESFLRRSVSKQAPDLVATSATLASQAAKKVLRDSAIPVVFFTVSDPVGAGLVEEIGVPTGTNITGRVHMIPRDVRVDMVMRLAGQVTTERPVRIGVVYSTYPSAVGDLRELEKIAQQRDDIVFVPYPVEYRGVPEGLTAMFADVKKGLALLEKEVDCWWEASGPLGELEEFTRILLENSDLPVIMGSTLKSTQIGTVLHLTPSAEQEGREAAAVAADILQGEAPGRIPVTPPSSFELGINLTAAVRHNIVIPPDLLQLAGEQVFR